MGYTLQGQDTIFKEEMKLMLFIDKFWVLEVSGVNENPTRFVFQKQFENSFVCVNKENEFPKEIEYQYSNNKIKAKVSNDSMEIAFDFEKID